MLETRLRRGIDPPAGKTIMKRILCLVLLLTVCCGSKQNNRIIVGSKNYSEQVILGEMIAQQIERSTALKVERKLNLGGSFICHNAIRSGEIDVYAEYTGTALTAILKKEPKTDPRAVFQDVKTAYQGLQLDWLDPFGFNNTFAILIRGDDARRLGLKTISDAAKYTPQWRPGFGYEFMERKDGFPGLAASYGLKFREAPRTMDLALTYRALADKQVDLRRRQLHRRPDCIAGSFPTPGRSPILSALRSRARRAHRCAEPTP